MSHPNNEKTPPSQNLYRLALWTAAGLMLVGVFDLLNDPPLPSYAQWALSSVFFGMAIVVGATGRAVRHLPLVWGGLVLGLVVVGATLVAGLLGSLLIRSAL
jgi:hypothetical protein